MRVVSNRVKVVRAAVMLAVIGMAAAPLMAGCSGAGHAQTGPSATASPAHPVTAKEANRLAAARFSVYREKMVSVAGTVVGARGSVTLRGWIDAVRHEGYGLVTTDHGGAFLTDWTATQVSAQDFSGTEPPLPKPADGWDTTALDADDSALAAAQLLLAGLASDRPDNAQLLRQNGARWLRSVTVDGVRLDVMSGPLGSGATVSNLRYWVDDSGRLHRLQARLDGRDWSTFDLAAAPGVSF